MLSEKYICALGAGAGAGGRRRGHPAGGDHLRHPQRQGADRAVGFRRESAVKANAGRAALASAARRRLVTASAQREGLAGSRVIASEGPKQRGLAGASGTALRVRGRVIGRCFSVYSLGYTEGHRALH